MSKALHATILDLPEDQFQKFLHLPETKRNRLGELCRLHAVSVDFVERQEMTNIALEIISGGCILSDADVLKVCDEVSKECRQDREAAL